MFTNFLTSFFEENFASYASTFFATLPWPSKKANELDSFFVCPPEMGCQRAVPELLKFADTYFPLHGTGPEDERAFYYTKLLYP